MSLDLQMPNQDKIKMINDFIAATDPLIAILNRFGKKRESSIAMQKMEEMIMWAQSLIINNDPMLTENESILVTNSSKLIS